ncbi:hypothetical protein [Aureitalea marina]|uniref:NfeD-like C-terminal domain-containing protein n=1 Tax=Aureitalea marina TaxID=930804 RepID=A0A2S7KSR9_9FLAO|nr:hypothetical protein [Aureitalea marina]PQB05672.1 hypothetical protein BST85_12770 [Aureitalea marina]
MNEWFTSLSTFEQVYWIAAIVGSGILLILLALTLIGGDVDDMGDVDADVEGDTGIGFQFFTLKNLIGFFTIFGWSGIACMEAGYSKGVTLAVSIGCGLLMMIVMAAIFYYLSKLYSSGTLNIANAIGAVGEVYLTIGPNRSSMGKVQVRVQGTLRELDALSDAEEELNQGQIVQVTQVTDNGVLIVNKYTK